MRKIPFTRELKATVLAASLMAGIVVTATIFADGCGKADEIFDCQSVCTRYRDCFKSDYDVDMCRQNCRNKSESDPSIRQDADQCSACIDDKSCASATFTCAVPCSSIVP